MALRVMAQNSRCAIACSRAQPCKHSHANTKSRGMGGRFLGLPGGAAAELSSGTTAAPTALRFSGRFAATLAATATGLTALPARGGGSAATAVAPLDAEGAVLLAGRFLGVPGAAAADAGADPPSAAKALRFVGRFSAGGVPAGPELVARPLRARRPLSMTEESGSIGGTVEARVPAFPPPERTAAMLARLRRRLTPPSFYPLSETHQTQHQTQISTTRK